MRGSISVSCVVGVSVIVGVMTTGITLLTHHQQWMGMRYDHMQAYYLALSGFAFAPNLESSIPVVAMGNSVDEDWLYENRYQGVSVSVNGGVVWLFDTPDSVRYSVAVLTPTSADQPTARAIVKRRLSLGGDV
jgi:hypothetical protein